jgi:hypothetical protein
MGEWNKWKNRLIFGKGTRFLSEILTTPCTGIFPNTEKTFIKQGFLGFLASRKYMLSWFA